MGANRIIPSIAIPYPLGDPEKSLAEEKAIRRKIVLKAIVALESELSSQKIFD